MTPQQALQVLSEATAVISTNRENHNTMVLAVNCLQELINSKEVKPESIAPEAITPEVIPEEVK